MSVQTRDFVDVAARSRELGCRVPVRLALLPGDFSTAANVGEFVFHPATPHVRSAWQRVGLEDEGPDHARDTPGENGDCTAAQPMGCSEGLSPFSRPQAGRGTRTQIPSPQPLAPFSNGVPLVAFFGSGLLTGPEWCLAVALGLVSRVLALHPACASPWEVRFHAVVGRPSGGCVCIEYQGDAFGIVALTRDVRRIWADR